MTSKNPRLVMFPVNLKGTRKVYFDLHITFCRFVYNVANQSYTINLLAFVYKMLRKLVAAAKAQKTIFILANLFTLNLKKRSGWVNLYTQRLYWKVLQAVEIKGGVEYLKPSLIVQHKPLRVGIYGKISGTLLTQKPFFEGIPSDIELFVFDYKVKDFTANYLREMVENYRLFEEVSNVQVITDSINRSKLDVLINIDYDLTAFHVLNLINVPCIVHLCSGTDIFHNEKISFQIHAQPEAEFFIKDGYMFSTISRQSFSNQRIYQGTVVYDIRDIHSKLVQFWANRRPLIFWHGSIYKLAKRPLVNILMKLLAEDSVLEFVFMGRDDLGRKSFVPSIKEIAKQYGVDARVYYEGQILAGRLSNGDVFIDQGWSQIKDYLLQARLWPDTFPVGGGAARVEAYASGTPSVHMGVKFDPLSWGKPQPGLVELPALLEPDGTAYSIKEYEDLCRKCLYDQPYADKLIQAQIALAEKSTDGQVFWKQLLEFYQDWLNNRI